MPAHASLRALLASSIDYAGMFPPCSLDLERALTNQAQYVRSKENWMLGAFVLPVDQFEAAKAMLSEFDPENRLRISALGPKTENAGAFSQAISKVNGAIRTLSAFNSDLVTIDQLEMFLPADANIELLKEAQSLTGNLPAFWEAPSTHAEKTIALIAKLNSEKPTFGFKLRTGGVTADAFPTSVQIAKVLRSAAMHQVPIKFTAGLHHPIRQYRDEVRTKMHGFLNVFGAAVLAADHEWDEKQTSAMLDDEDAKSFQFENEVFSWRDWKIDLKRLKDRRKLVISFGSCSFDEPCEDLRTLGLL
jgi:hypothetical protein